MIAIIAMIDAILSWLGQYINLSSSTPLMIELILSYLLYPVAFLLGVPRNGDLRKVSRLIGIKILKVSDLFHNASPSAENCTEQVCGLYRTPAYASLSSRSRLIATYSLCGFGNLGTLGSQIGLMSKMAQGRSGDIARVAGSAWVTGIIATLLSASMAGILITDQAASFSTVGLNTTIIDSVVMNATLIGRALLSFLV